MGSKYILIIMVVILGLVIYYLPLLFVFPKCSMMSIYYLYNKKSHINCFFFLFFPPKGGTPFLEVLQY